MILNDKTASGNIIGRVLLIEADNKYVYNQRTERIEPFSSLDSRFLYSLLNAPIIRDRIVKQSQGNTQIYVNWTNIKETEYSIPNLFEQRKLGIFINNLDNLITLHQCLLINEIITLSNPISPLIIVSLPYLVQPLPESKYLTRKTDNLEKTIKNNQKQTKSLKYRVSHPYSCNRVIYRTLRGNRVRY